METEKRFVNMKMPCDLVARLDDEADRQHITRTAYVCKACEQVLQKDEFLRNSPEIQQKMNELLDLFPRA